MSNNKANIKVDMEKAKYLLETMKVKDRGAVVDMIKEITEEIAPMPEAVERDLKKYATLPALQLLLLGLLDKDEMGVTLAQIMIQQDCMSEVQLEMDAHPERFKDTGLEFEETKAC